MKTEHIAHYNANVAEMSNRPWFYDGVLAVWQQARIPQHAAICDIGCGTGLLLARLQQLGYHNLHGCDFADGCVQASRAYLPNATIYQHDIEEAPLPNTYDLITITNVFDFLANPQAALNNIRQSLRPGGQVLFTFRNRLAYWPWYHLRHVAAIIPNPRLRHWWLWFTTPLGMRRNDQPIEHVPSINESRNLLSRSGFQIQKEAGFQRLPMLWIPDLAGWLRILQLIDTRASRIMGPWFCYTTIFLCQ